MSKNNKTNRVGQGSQSSPKYLEAWQFYKDPSGLKLQSFGREGVQKKSRWAEFRSQDSGCHLDFRAPPCIYPNNYTSVS